MSLTHRLWKALPPRRLSTGKETPSNHRLRLQPDAPSPYLPIKILIKKMKRRKFTTAGTLWVISSHMSGSRGRSRPSGGGGVGRKAAVAAADSPGQARGSGSRWGRCIAVLGAWETGFGTTGLPLAPSCPAPTSPDPGDHGTDLPILPASPARLSPARLPSLDSVHAAVLLTCPAASPRVTFHHFPRALGIPCALEPVLGRGAQLDHIFSPPDPGMHPQGGKGGSPCWPEPLLPGRTPPASPCDVIEERDHQPDI